LVQNPFYIWRLLNGSDSLVGREYGRHFDMAASILFDA